MRLFQKWQRVAACLLAAGLLSAVFIRQGHAQGGTYEVVDLGSLGGLQSKAFGLNNSGRIVGDSTLSAGASVASPFTWTAGQLTSVGSFGGEGGAAFALNQLGYSVGYATTATNRKHAFIWSDIFGKLDIGTLPGGSFASAYDINDANQVVGQSEIGPLVDRGFVWQSSTGMQVIPSFDGTGASGANGINNKGQIVGWSATASNAAHAFILSGGVMTDLGTLGGSNSVAQKINEAGEVVGYAGIASNSASQPYHAFRWSASTGMADLGTLGGSRSMAHDINGIGVIIGTSEIAPGVWRAFIYDQYLGMQNLNNYLVTSGWTLQEARSINDKGQIVGFGINPSGQTHAFLLIPQSDEVPGGEPPPCTVTPTAQPILLPQPTALQRVAPARKPAAKVRGR